MPWCGQPVMTLAWSFSEDSILVTPIKVFLKAYLGWDEMRNQQLYMEKAELHRDLTESHNFYKRFSMYKKT